MWRRATFKEKDVWAEVDASGGLAVSSGRVAIRYQDREGARLYRAAGAGVTLKDGPAVDLPAGVPADEGRAAASTGRRGSGFGSANTRTAAQAVAAAASAGDLVRRLQSDTILCFTDGGCEPNPGPAGSGACVVFPDGRRASASRSLGRGTNNIGELDAVALALDVLASSGVERSRRVAVLTDSKYTIGMLALGWKATANREQIVRLRERLGEWPNLEIHWVAGHTGVAGNEAADRLAAEGIAGRTHTRWDGQSSDP